MPETKEQLLARLDELREIYVKLDEKYYQLEAKYSRKHPKVIKIVEKLNKICDEAEKIDLKIFEMERTKGSNGTICIRQSEIDDDTHFDICLCDNNEVIGSIIDQKRAYCPAIKSYCDNIAYSIDSECHRGHGYAFQALCLFVNYLYSENVENIQLFARNNNIPSLKTIEKFNTLVNAIKIEKDEWETCYYFELDEINMPLQISQQIITNKPATKEQLIAKLHKLGDKCGESLMKGTTQDLEKFNKAYVELKKQILETYGIKFSNGTIYIRQSEIEFPTKFDICLCDTKEVIGDIGYQEEAYCMATKSSCNNISYEIESECHRGHGYAFQALCLFVNYLYSEKNIKQIQIWADNYNIPSLKTIEKFNTLVNAVKIGKDECRTCYYFELNEMNMPLQIETNYHK